MCGTARTTTRCGAWLATSPPSAVRQEAQLEPNNNHNSYKSLVACIYLSCLVSRCPAQTELPLAVNVAFNRKGFYVLSPLPYNGVYRVELQVYRPATPLCCTTVLQVAGYISKVTELEVDCQAAGCTAIKYIVLSPVLVLYTVPCLHHCIVRYVRRPARPGSSLPGTTPARRTSTST